MKHASLVTIAWLLMVNISRAQPAEQNAIGGDESAAVTSSSSEAKPSRSPELGGKGAPTRTTASSICEMVGAAAATYGLPVEFFTRIIAQESGFKADAVGPVTRSGHRAQGIAQFMPMTAAEHLLHDPFNPVEALPKSAEFLRDLRAQFGNLGLAAAAYNAGPQRVRNWLVGKETLPLETQAYVQKVTGHSAQEWSRPQLVPTLSVPKDASCAEVARAATKSGVSGVAVASGQAAVTPMRLVSAALWAVQLIGDKSENKARDLYGQLQKRHQAILGSYQPVVLQTSLRGNSAPIWNRIRLNVSNREVADSLCGRLRAAGETCLVQRN